MQRQIGSELRGAREREARREEKGEARRLDLIAPALFLSRLERETLAERGESARNEEGRETRQKRREKEAREGGGGTI